MKLRKILIPTLCLLLFITSCSQVGQGDIPVNGTNSAFIGTQNQSQLTTIEETSAVSSQFTDITQASGFISATPNTTAASQKPAETLVASDTAAASTAPNNAYKELEEKYPNSAFLMYCVEDNKIICSGNQDKKIAPASLTKLLTASTALYYVNSEQVFTVGSEQDLVPPKSSLCLILKGHRLKLTDLLTGMLMASGNDAAYTVAVSVARTVSRDESMSDKQAVSYFVDLMNSFAQKIGMTDSRFATPDGFDAEGQYTTASDLIKLAKYVLSVPEISGICQTYQKTVVFESGEIAQWTNSNKLINPESSFYNKSAIGLKTGTTENSGYSLISAFKKDKKTYICSVLNCSSDSDRYSLALSCFNLC